MAVSWPLSSPPIAAYTAPMKNTAAITMVVLIPTTLDTSSSSPIARTAFPNDVFFRRRSNATKPTSATPMVKTLNPLMLPPKIVNGSLPKASGSGRGALSKTMTVAAVIASKMPNEATSIMSGDLARSRMYTYKPR